MSSIILSMKSDLKPTFTQPTMYFQDKKFSPRKMSLNQVKITFPTD